MHILTELTDGPGYCLDYALTANELANVYRMISRQYLARMAVLAPDLVETAAAVGIENYHTLPIPFDHACSWPKETRLLPACHLDAFRRMAVLSPYRGAIRPGSDQP